MLENYVIRSGDDDGLRLRSSQTVAECAWLSRSGTAFDAVMISDPQVKIISTHLN